MATLDDLQHVIRTCPVIDNHAHNLLLPSKQEAYDLLSATTEAHGEALEDTPTSLSHLRAVKQLRELYGCQEDADWDDLMRKRTELLHDDFEGFLRKCLVGIHSILMDDGLDGTTVYLYDWHDDFISHMTKRIVRIETVAADILRGMHHKGSLPMGTLIHNDDLCAQAWVAFLEAFEAAIVNEIEDSEVAGFKSVICYRTGLDVEIAGDVQIATSGLDAFQSSFLPNCLNHDFRVECKGLNDCILISTCRLLAASSKQGGVAKPLQFHTGLGDSDISLLRSDPSYLQPLISRFPDVKIVLLHSSYPYTRQAGYLATVYKNVYLDLGEVFPQVSRDGQETIIRQSMEVTPISKLLFSTDAHHFGEVYWLALKQFRQAFEKVLVDYVQHEDLTVQQAINAAKDIYFNNTNRLYNLEATLPEFSGVSKESQDEPAVTIPQRLRLPWRENRPQVNPYDLKVFRSFTKHHPDLQFVYIQWLDYMATMRARILPVAEFRRIVNESRRIGVSRGNLGTLQNDHITPAVTATGQLYVEPDLNSLRITHSKDPLASATVMASFRDAEGRPSLSCPRSSLKALVDRFSSEHGIDLVAGFEIEVVFLTNNPLYNSYKPWTTNHAWGTFTPEQFERVLPVLAEIASELESVGIHVQQFHSESGPGQYEFVLSPLPVLQAIDVLIQARQVVHQIARTHDLRATLHPLPLDGVGSGQHAHVSLDSPKLSPGDLEQKELSFFASVLEHLPSICAFTLPNTVSYARVGDGLWAGGAWVAWGTQNREVPLRKIDRGRWEVRCMDGLANPYLCLGALLAAGLLGVERSQELTMKDCLENPARLSEQDREGYGIEERLPASLEESLAALEADDVLQEALGGDIARNYVTMKRSEKEMLDSMTEDERRVWLIERY